MVHLGGLDTHYPPKCWLLDIWPSYRIYVVFYELVVRGIAIQAFLVAFMYVVRVPRSVFEWLLIFTELY